MSPAQALKHEVRRRLNYYAARYLVDPMRSSAQRVRTRFSYVERVLEQVLLSATDKHVGRMNRVLGDAARVEFAPTLQRLVGISPGVAGTVNPRDQVQDAFVVEAVTTYARKFAQPRILCVGPAGALATTALKRMGFQVQTIHPDLDTATLGLVDGTTPSREPGYDIVYAMSTLNHVADDLGFARQIGRLLASGGIGIFTCELVDTHSEAEPIVDGHRRLYDSRSLFDRVVAQLPDCELVDVPAWEGGRGALERNESTRACATVVFRKGINLAFGVSFGDLGRKEQAQFFDDNGFLVVPRVLSPAEVENALAELKGSGLKGTTEEVWSLPSAHALVINTKLLVALRAVFGEDIRFFKAAYVEKVPDTFIPPQRIRRMLHVDYGIGEDSGDFRNSTASWTNVGIYLTALTAEHAPLWVVPGSHRKFDVVPGTNMEHLAGDAKMVLAEAGDAVIFHARTVHAASYNCSQETRHTYFYQYRPAWAKPAGPVPEWPEEFVKSFPQEHRGLFLGLNRGL